MSIRETAKDIDHAASSVTRFLRKAMNHLHPDYTSKGDSVVAQEARVDAANALDELCGAVTYLFEMLHGTGVNKDALSMDDLIENAKHIDDIKEGRYDL